MGFIKERFSGLRGGGERVRRLMKDKKRKTQKKVILIIMIRNYYKPQVDLVVEVRG